MKTFFVFGDTHITPESLKTMAALEAFAKYCVLKRPDVIVNLGDTGSFDSASKYIKDRGNFTTDAEIAAVKAAYGNFFKIFEDFNDLQRQRHEKLYKPTFIVCLGNHEARSPLITLEIASFFDNYKCLVRPYKTDYTCHGITFAHSFIHGRTGNICSNTDDILSSTLCNTVSAHGHVRELSEIKDRFGRRLTALRCPCLNCDNPEWAGTTSMKWDRGWLELYVDGKVLKGFIFRDLHDA